MTIELAKLHMALRREILRESVGDLEQDIEAFDMAIDALNSAKKNILKPYLDKLKKRVLDKSFDYYFEEGEYVGENSAKRSIINTDTVIKIIDELLIDGVDKW